MTRIVVASTNPVKIAAVRAGFTRMFPDAADTFQFAGISVPSGVSDQPMSDAETLRGAFNRATNARQEQPDAAFTVGVEGGVELVNDELLVFAWIVVLGRDGSGKSRTATFNLPDEVSRLVRQGLELGDADDQVFNRANSKQQTGSVGLLTGDIIDRARYYEQAVMLALIPFKNPTLTFRDVRLQ
jgi:inosine/xanthosine triphosphatase